MTCAYNRLPKRDPRLLLGAIVSGALLWMLAGCVTPREAQYRAKAAYNEGKRAGTEIGRGLCPVCEAPKPAPKVKK